MTADLFHEPTPGFLLGGIGASGWSSFAARRSVRFSDDTPPLQPVVGVDIGARLRGMWG